MGAGASTVPEVAGLSTETQEALKTLPDAAKAELLAKMAKMPTSEVAWQAVYGALGCLATKDIGECVKHLLNDGEDQVAKEAHAISFIVLGGATPTTEGYAVPPETKSQVFWVAPFESKEAYNSKDHHERPARAENFGAIMKTALTGNPMADMAGGYMGPLWLLEKSTTTATGLYSIYVAAKAKDASGAHALVEANKAHGLRQLATESGALRYMIIPPGGDMPGGDSDDAKLTVRWVETWQTAADHEAHKKSAHLAEVGPKMKELTTEMNVIEFATTAHFGKGRSA